MNQWWFNLAAVSVQWLRSVTRGLYMCMLRCICLCIIPKLRYGIDTKILKTSKLNAKLVFWQLCSIHWFQIFEGFCLWTPTRTKSPRKLSTARGKNAHFFFQLIWAVNIIGIQLLNIFEDFAVLHGPTQFMFSN